MSVRGVVQGVGFRPFAHALALRLGLGGFVQNEPAGVEMELEGPDAAIAAFLSHLSSSPPALARIREIRTSELAPLGEARFTIRASAQDGGRNVLISPDIAVCPACLRELRDPNDRRYRYPFINCTHCGPRYTIIHDLPYDRARTTMADFEMCCDCRAEYHDPADRRFHAQPTCCPACGPHVELFSSDSHGGALTHEEAIAASVKYLADGAVLAVKGIGGFHLACDARNPEAVRRLRTRKHRDMKPFALMVRDLAEAEHICYVDDRARTILEGRERPILLLRKRDGHGLAEEVAPRSECFGVMLPYTPLHHLLLDGPCAVLVMTSGNITDEPIAHRNEEALSRLASLADAFLLHNRGIHIRTDDSVARMVAGKVRFLRRSRGYAPFPVQLPFQTSDQDVLAVGGELNNTICLTRGRDAFLSHHIGDLQNVPAYEAFLQAVEHLQDVLVVTPGAVACDLHPGYLATRYARECGVTLVGVQHHHAHAGSVLAETGYTDKVIGVIFDGMGWGNDDTPWGGEFLVCDLADFHRVGCLEPVAQPGGDAAARKPPRMAYSFLRAAFGDQADALANELLPDFAETELRAVRDMIQRGLNSPLTSSMGRLFDAASALLSICSENTYHAQAPMELEAYAACAEDETGSYSVHIGQAPGNHLIVRTSDLIRELVSDFRRGSSVETCAARFHHAVARFTLEVCTRIRENTGLSTVALSGGVFANAVLVERTVPLLEGKGFNVLLNAEVPAGDGGISLGQAAIAAWRLACA